MNIKESNSPVAENIRRIIKEKGFKQYKVAKAAGYDKHKFNKMLNGQHLIRPIDVARMKKVLCVSYDEIYKE